jgi:hypothetical protein
MGYTLIVAILIWLFIEGIALMLVFDRLEDIETLLAIEAQRTGGAADQVSDISFHTEAK